MGQQQLILLVLATVIVGIAIVIGISAFTENSARANADAMLQDAVRMANDAQATVKKPTAFGGVGALTAATFAKMGYPDGDGDGYYANLNGAYEITTLGTDGILITGYGGDGVVTDDADGDGQTDTDADGNTLYSVDRELVTQEVAVAVCGPTEGDITSAILTIGGNPTGATAPTCGGA